MTTPTLTPADREIIAALSPSTDASVLGALSLEVTATIRVRQTVDLVAVFAGLHAVDQQHYQSLDLAEVGFEEEWERPLAFLWPEDDDVVPFNLSRSVNAPVWGDIQECEVRLRQRGETRHYGREAAWSEADFDMLVAQVPWMAAFHRPVSEDDLSHLPGPDDVPLF